MHDEDKRGVQEGMDYFLILPPPHPLPWLKSLCRVLLRFQVAIYTMKKMEGKLYSAPRYKAPNDLKVC